MAHAEGFAVCTENGWEKLMTQEDYLCEFSEKMVNLLTEEAVRALQAPNHEGLEYAAYLLQDALRYDTLYCRAIRSYPMPPKNSASGILYRTRTPSGKKEDKNGFVQFGRH